MDRARFASIAGNTAAGTALAASFIICPS